MLKRTLLPLICMLISGTSFSQSTLTHANFTPVIGDNFAIRICDTTGVLPGPAGPSTNWDFSGLVTTSVDTTRSILWTTGAGYLNFPGSTNAINGSAFYPTSTVYYKADAAKLSQNGYYAAPDTNLILSDPADQLRYPFTYPNSFNDNFAGILRLGPISAHHNGVLNVVCDGYGTLTLPTRVDANVLRVHSTQTFTDSINVFGAPVLKTYTISSYDWYKPDFHTSLLTIQTVTELGAPAPSFKVVAYAQAKVVGVDEVKSNISAFQLSPNPATDMLNIQFASTDNSRVRVSLYDMLGKEIAVISDKTGKGNQHISYNTKNLPRGIYLVHIQAGTETLSKKLELQ